MMSGYSGAKVLVLLALSLGLPYSTATAETQPPAKAEMARSPAPLVPSGTADPHSVPPADREIIALQEQNAILKEYQSSLLETVYWALGVVVTLTLLLAGFGWFSNFKMYEADKASLREEFERRTKGHEANFQAALSKSQAENLLAIDSKLELVANRAFLELGTTKAEWLDKLDDFKGNVAELMQDLSVVNERAEDTEKAVLLTQVALRSVEEHIWEIKGIPTNILITQAQGLEAAAEAEDASQVKSVLIRMKDTFVRKLPADEKLTPSVVRLIDERLSKAGKYDEVLANEVRELLAGRKDDSK